MDTRKNEKIAVLAGTLVDTQMGMTLLENHGLAGMAFPLTENPRRQVEFQLMPLEEKLLAVRLVLVAGSEAGLPPRAGVLQFFVRLGGLPGIGSRNGPADRHPYGYVP